MKRVLLSLAIGLLAATQTVWTADPFKIQTIQVKGLRGVKQEAVLRHLPVKVGDWFQLSHAESVIKQLYATGFFDDVQLKQEGEGLTIVLKERPIIRQIKLEGQHGVPQEGFDKILKDLGLMSGDFFNPSALEQLKIQLLVGAYPQMSQYAAKVSSDVTQLNAGQVDVHLKFDTGPSLRFGGIRFLGNHAITESQLLSALPVHTNRIWAFLTNRTTCFNETTKQQGLTAIRNFYKDRGYVDMTVTADYMSITPHRDAAYWVIRIKEGDQYKVGRYRVVGQHPFSDTECMQLIQFKSGDIYSRQELKNTEQAIADKLKDEGYLFARVNIVPTVQPTTKRVDLIVQINPGKKTYIRRIQILGNYYIEDRVIRRLFTQQEASLASRSAIEASEQRLNRSGFVKSAAALVPVPVLGGADDQVDLQLQMDESFSKFNIGGNIGGSSISSWKKIWEGLTLDFNVRMENILGTGVTGDVTAKKTQYGDYVASIDYDNPYFTLDGIQSYSRLYFARSQLAENLVKNFGITSNEKDDESDQASPKEKLQVGPGDSASSKNGTKPKKKTELLRSQYETGVIGLQQMWSFPIDNKGNLWRFKAEAKHLSLYLLPEDKAKQAQELKDFVNQYGDGWFQALFTAGFYHNQLEGFIFPYKGTQHNINLLGALSWGRKWEDKKVDTTFYPYFKLSYHGAILYPFLKTGNNQEWTVGARWNLGYGNTFKQSKEKLPFFDNYHSGRLRGYENDSLGPKDSRGNMLGANFLVSGSAMLCFPEPISGPRHRVSWFLDVGNLYQVDGLQAWGQSRYDSLKASTGLAVDFVIPMPAMLGSNLPINVSLGYPFKVQDTDREANFQFSIGFSFVDQF